MVITVTANGMSALVCLRVNSNNADNPSRNNMLIMFIISMVAFGIGIAAK